MQRFFWRSLLVTPTFLGVTIFASVASAQQAGRSLGISDAATPAESPTSVMEQVINYGENTGKERIGQVTSVSQFSDVRPTDWAFQALQSLVERYGCIVGYPDRTFRGNRAMTRYEFAAGLNACMERINELIASATADLVKKEDLETLQRLMEEFEAELAGLRARIDSLEGRTAKLEKQQFSTTTKLNATALFVLGSVWGDEGAIGRITSQESGTVAAGATLPSNISVFNPANSAAAPFPALNLSSTTGGILDRDGAARVIQEVYRVRGLNLTPTALTTALNTLGNQTVTAGGRTFRRFDPPAPDLEDELTLSGRVRLNFDTSFTGKDRLRTRLEAGNIIGSSQGGTNNTGTNMTRLGYDTDTDNAFRLDELWYRFPVGNQLRIQVDATNAEFNDSVIYTFNPLFQSSDTGSISRYGRFSPIYRLPGDRSAGAAFSFNLQDSSRSFISLEGGYDGGGNAGLLSNPASGEDKNGLFNGGYAAFGQIVVRPSPTWDLGFTYSNTYFPEGTVNLSRSTGSDLSRRPFGNNVATSGHHFGFQTSYRVSPRFTVAGWFGYTIASAEGSLQANVSGIPGLAGTTPISIVSQGDDARMMYWGLTLGFTDLGKKGALAGLIIGQQPRVIDNDSLFGDEDDSNWHIEALYRFPVNDFIDITPGLLVIVNPENNSDNGTIYVGTVRATFKF